MQCTSKYLAIPYLTWPREINIIKNSNYEVCINHSNSYESIYRFTNYFSQRTQADHLN